MKRALAIGLSLLAWGCAAHALWLSGHPPILEQYENVRVRIYRAGLECRLEVIGVNESIITLPTRCLTVPHVIR